MTCRDFNAFVKAMVALILLATQRIAILDALFPGDLTMPGMLRMKVFFAERPHARIVRLDVTRADAYPGVVAVFTTKDVPVNEYGLQKNDQPVLCGLAPLPPFDFAKDRAGEG